MSEADETQQLRSENAALRQRVQEFEDTLAAIQGGEVDALVVSAELYTLESAHAAGTRLRQHVLDQMDEAVFAFDVDGHLVYLNAAAERRYVVKASEVLGRAGDAIFLESDLVTLAVADDASMGDRISRRMSTHTLPGGRTLKVESSVSALVDHDGWTIGQLVVTRDVTQRLEADARRQALTIALGVSEAGLRAANENLEAAVAARTAELLKAQEALRQSQKMEAVGQLTGGLAHDFNNLLTGIIGSLDLLQRRIGQGRLDAVDRYIGAAQGAARRAGALTQRLLAFSRRQTLDPKNVDVNRLVIGMEELIQRTVGPSIQLRVSGAPNLWSALIDASQLENALLNLCINSRDAMPDGGRLTVELSNVVLESAHAADKGLEPGNYVLLCVTDSGTGMSEVVASRAFDPFFTTKPIGQGTGLGLSMVYGFARQSAGQVTINSEVGKGTAIDMYLPRYAGDAEPNDGDANPLSMAQTAGGETVLVVDDEPTVRMLACDVLQEAGYITLEAEDGTGALKVLRSNQHLDLLVSDVGLPGEMNGRQVADAARALRPGLGVLFITGYAATAAVGNGQMEQGMDVLCKPFSGDELTHRVQALLKNR